MLKLSFKVAAVALAAVSSLVLAACAAGGSSSSSPEASGSYGKALEAAYQGIVQQPSLEPVELKAPEQNVAIIACSQALSPCKNQADAVSAAVTDVGWWPMVIDSESGNGFGSAIRQAVAQSATLIVVVDANCSAGDVYFGEAALAGIPVIALGGKDDCKPGRYDAVTQWTDSYPIGKRMAAVGKLQADYAYGKLAGDVKALVLTQTGASAPTVAGDAFAAELKSLGSGKVAQTLDLGAGEIADKSFVSKVVDAAKSSGANIIVCPDDAWVTVGGLGDALKADAKTKNVIVIGRGGSEEAMNAIRSGKSPLVATVAQAFDWQGAATVDAALRLFAGQRLPLFGDAMQVVDAQHNMPASGPYEPEVNGAKDYATFWIRPTSGSSSTPSPTKTGTAN